MSFLSDNAEFKKQTTKVKHPIYELEFERLGRNVQVYNPSEREIAILATLAASTIQPMASVESLCRVYRHNPDTFVAFRKLGQPANGMLAHLPLNKDGFKALFDGRLNTLDPADVFLCRQNERPVAIYYWCIFMGSGVAGGLSLAMERVAKYRDLPTFCRSANDTAFRLLTGLGFKYGATWQADDAHQEIHYRRDIMQYRQPPRPPYDSFGLSQPKRGEIGITVARTWDAVMVATSIRGAAYVENRFIPITEDIDGNDCSGSHLIAYFGTEPVGCIRLRYFGWGVKLERLAVIPRFQRRKIASGLISAAIEFSRVKGFNRFYIHVADNAWPVWKRFGFALRETSGLEYPSGEVYREADLVVSPKPDPLTWNSGPAVLVRPEGQWDRPGVLEKDAPDADTAFMETPIPPPLASGPGILSIDGSEYVESWGAPP